MPLIAKASNTVRNKNLLILAMCLVFTIWFSYDGFVRYPQTNDAAAEKLKSMMSDNKLKAQTPEQLDHWTALLQTWPGWNKASTDDRQQLYEIAENGSKIAGGIEGFKKPFDIELQRYIVYGLFAATLISLWWLIHCQKRRAIAEENTVSPSPGVTIPWDKITLVDNTRWKKSGIVDITYLDSANNPQKAKFDDYELDREPLLEILDQLAEKAQKAEFIPKEDPTETPAA